MPCSYFGPGEASGIQSRELKKELDTLTAEADIMREYIIALSEGKTPTVPTEVLTVIKKRQVAHRKMDLKRLEATFIKSKDTARLAKVWAAKPSQPLEPQLGFDPDACWSRHMQ